MGGLTPRATRTRVAGGATAFAITTVILLLAGLEMQSYLVGIVAGVVVLALPGAALWMRKRRPDSTDSD